MALVMTPNDPTGNAIGVTTAAQLARQRLLVLDERSAEMQRRSMIPLVEEFDSIVLLRSFADWAGLEPTRLSMPFHDSASPARSTGLTNLGIRTAGRTRGGQQCFQAGCIAHRVRLERLRLYRMLRKLNFLIPYPSDAGYVLAEVTRGDRERSPGAGRAGNLGLLPPKDPDYGRHCAFRRSRPRRPGSCRMRWSISAAM